MNSFNKFITSVTYLIEACRLKYVKFLSPFRRNILIPPLYLLNGLMVTVCMLSACGGSGGGTTNTTFTSSVSPIITSSTAHSASVPQASSSSQQSMVSLSGSITYDYVPHHSNHIGLNYSATEKRAVRGAVIELLDATGTIVSSEVVKNDGSYGFTVPKNTLVKVRVKAELLQQISPSWNFKVTDNTSNNALYALEGSLTSSGATNSVRNLHAISGWDGARYAFGRAAAPFAILDNVYIAINRLNDAGNARDLVPMELHWSKANNAAEGDKSNGEIGTTFFDGSVIYILGDADNDTDEYDAHVLLHEWGHYLEDNLSRTDSYGGAHSDGEKLDMRVSMSEGFANAFSAMMLNDPNYTDASGGAQSSGFFLNVSKKSRVAKGFFSEGSVGSIIYNYYISSSNKSINDFSPILAILSDKSYYANEAMTSIFLFYDRLNVLFSNQAAAFNQLMIEQNIFGSDEYAANEINDGGLASSLPIYKSIKSDGVPINICSSPEFGKYNKLANIQLLKLTIVQAGSYTFSAEKFGGADVKSNPELVLYKRGSEIHYAKNSVSDKVSTNVSLLSGIYILEAYDASNRDENNTESNTFCFNIKIMAN